MRKSITRTAAALAVAGLFSGAASALDLSTAGFVTYGDTQSYALALLNYQAVGGNNPGDPFYVNSTPGAIQNLVVVATGASGQNLNTNFLGMDNAYQTPSGKSGSPFFSTTTGTVFGANTNGATVKNNLSTTWDSSVSAMLNFLNGQSMTFFFNNNQINSGTDASLQSLAAYAQAWITAPDGSVYGQVFEFTNRDQAYDVVPHGGGIPSSTDPNAAFAYSSGITTPPVNPIAGDNLHTDYVLSGGQLCVDSGGNFVDCSSPNAVIRANNNLGANQAAYALIVPELNSLLTGLAGNPLASQYTLHVAVWLGCDPSIPANEVATTCNGSPYGRSLNNGYEQIFIAGLNQVINVPEPGTLALIGLALAGLGFTVYRTGRARS